MSHWGVFHDDDVHYGDKHVMPCYPDGGPIRPHEPSRECACGPRLDSGIYVHNDPERGLDA